MKLYTYSYNADYNPSMPVVEVILQAPLSDDATGPVSALIDSGADATLVPADLLEQIGAVSVSTGRLLWLWQESRTVNIYLVQMRIGPYWLRSVRVAGVPAGTDFVLGRNVLNQMVVTLNGQAGMVEIPEVS
jgi:predicted aspartyl protease